MTLERYCQATTHRAVGTFLMLSIVLGGCASSSPPSPATGAEGRTVQALLGHWQGEVLTSGEERDRTLYVSSVQQQNGGWTASGIVGRTGERLYPFTTDVRGDGAHPQLTVMARSGTRFDLTLDGPTYLDGKGYPAGGGRPFFIGLERLDAPGDSSSTL